MPIPYRIKSLDDVGEELRPLYRKHGNALVLDLSDVDPNDAIGLKQNRDDLLREIVELKQQVRRDPEEQFRPIEGLPDQFVADALKRLKGLSGDARQAELQKIEAEMDVHIEPHIAKAKAKLQSEHQDRMTHLANEARRILCEQTAAKIAGEIATPAGVALMVPHIVSRLQAELGPDNSVEGHRIIVLDGSGNQTDATTDALVAEFRDTPAFAPILSNHGPGARAAELRMVAIATGRLQPGKALARAEFDALSPTQRAEHMKGGGSIADSTPENPPRNAA